MKQRLITIDSLCLQAGFSFSFSRTISVFFPPVFSTCVLSLYRLLSSIILSFDWVPPFSCRVLLNRGCSRCFRKRFSSFILIEPAFLSVSFSLLRPNFRWFFLFTTAIGCKCWFIRFRPAAFGYCLSEWLQAFLRSSSTAVCQSSPSSNWLLQSFIKHSSFFRLIVAGCTLQTIFWVVGCCCQAIETVFLPTNCFTCLKYCALPLDRLPHVFYATSFFYYNW